MKKEKYLLILVLAFTMSAPSLLAQSSNKVPEQVKGTFLYDLNFLKKYHKDLVVLSNGDAKLIVVPKYQGRVMTSTAEGDQGLSFGWINHDLIASQKNTPHFSAYGGEDRFWLGPEGGQFSIYFKPNSTFVFDNWLVPPSIDVESFDLIHQSKTEAQFKKKFI